jgi:tRNA dimethylallyltransferase
VVAVVGPTASGKSAAAMAVARHDPRVEVVAVDAFTVYRGMDVGTAKPTRADREAVVHHCIDLLDPTAQVDVAWFRDRARAAIAQVQARGHVPVLVGGAGLYFRAVVDDMRFAPTDERLRERIEARWAGRPEDAHAHLATIDPDAAARIDPGNLRRTVRALEVIELTGEPFSVRSNTPYRSVVGSLDVVLLDPPRDALRARIRARAAAMVDDGLLEEAAALRERHAELSTTASQAIGYAEAFAVLDGRMAAEDAADAIARRTWAYARRQRSWFTRDPRCADPVGDVSAAVGRLRRSLAAIGE